MHCSFSNGQTGIDFVCAISSVQIFGDVFSRTHEVEIARNLSDFSDAEVSTDRNLSNSHRPRRIKCFGANFSSDFRPHLELERHRLEVGLTVWK